MTRTHLGKTTDCRGDWNRSACFSVLVAAFAAMGLMVGSTRSDAQAAPPTSHAVAAVPTIKILTIGSFTARATPAAWKPILPSEMRATARLYLAGRIDQWYVKQDQSGVVFILNLTDPVEARALLEKLPLGKAGLMKFQIIPLGPLSPLGTLLPERPK